MNIIQGHHDSSLSRVLSPRTRVLFLDDDLDSKIEEETKQNYDRYDERYFIEYQIGRS